MDFIKKNALLVGMVVAFVALLGGSLFLLKMKIDEDLKTEDDLNQKLQERRDLWSRDPYPSESNIDVIKNALKVREELSNSIKTSLNAPTLSFPKVQGSEFQKSLFNVQAELAEKLKQQAVSIPEKFQFGFDAYENKRPEEADTPNLQKQLKIVEELVDLCAKARIAKLNSIRRDEFEERKQAPSSPAGGRSSGSSTPRDYKPGPPSKEPLISPGSELFNVESKEHIYSIMPFKLEIECDTDSLRNLLNLIARSQYVFITRAVHVENVRRENVKAVPPIEPKPGEDPDIEAMQPVMGGLDEKLEVGILVNFIEFESKEKPATPKAQNTKKK
jgi:hypothetical protein